jgi:hypothetical protein
MIISDFLLLAFGTWGAVWLLVYGTGPGAILARMRKLVGVRYDRQGNRYGETWLGELFNCPICLSVWAAPVILIILLVWWYAVAVLAAVGVVILLSNYCNMHS